MRFTWLFAPIGITLGLLAFFLHSAEPTTAMEHHIPFIALYGEESAISLAMQPYLTSGVLKDVRQYPTPGSYLHEKNLTAPPATNNLAIRLFEVTQPPLAVQSVISDIITTTLSINNVESIYPDFKFLSYLPQEVVIHGECTDVNTIANSFDPIINFEQNIQLDYPGAGPAAQCIRRFTITDPSKTVDQLVNEVGATVGTARAEPNFMTNGFMGGFAIYGSSSGIRHGAPATSTVGTSPLTETTGVDVGVYLFDTSPYTSALPIFARTIITKPIRVAHPVLIPPQPNMPFVPIVDIASHGTFVATPIVTLAPDSAVTLVRILNNDGLGTQFNFALGVDWAIRDALLNGNDWNGTIFNYSLGIEDEANDQAQTAMQRILDIVDNLDIVQVAAAGNESAHAAMPLPMNLPAAHPAVMGVTAITQENMIACYANSGASPTGGFAARGGGAPRGVPSCNPTAFVHDCQTIGRIGCLHGWDPTSPTNYSYGIGTSFAAPHITGFAAQLIEHMSPTRTTTSWIIPADLQQQMVQLVQSGGDELGNGYIGPYQNQTPTAVGLLTTASQRVNPAHILLTIMLVLSVVIIKKYTFTRK